MSTNYQVLSDCEHILLRKPMYMGEYKTVEKTVYTCTIDSQTDKLVVKKEKLKVSPGLMKLFDEVAMNAVDHIKYSGKGMKKVTYIDFTYNETGISCKNDGKPLPIELYENTGKYIPEVLFTQPRSGSNFTKKTEAAGQNGIGVKLVTILSKEVKLDISDGKNVYKQTILNNNRNIYKPVITKASDKERYVKYAFLPDLAAIDETTSSREWSSVYKNTLKCFTRRILELRTFIPESVDVSINDMGIGHISFRDFATNVWKAFKETKKNSNGGYEESVYFERAGLKMFLGMSPRFEQISYVNGVFTEDGGRHIDILIKNLSRRWNINGLRNNLFIALSIEVSTPEFGSQAKTKLIGADTDLDQLLMLPDKECARMYNVLKLDSLVDIANLNKLKKTVETTKTRLSRKDVPKLVDAECAGKKGAFNTLFICEGDSASSLAKIGMTCPEIGHKHFGCLPLQGKINNLRDPSSSYNKKIRNLAKGEKAEASLEKSIITMLFKTIGVIPGTHYSNVNELRYQRVVVLKDADSDGANILGLVYNVFDVFFPELLKIDGFFCEFITPMIKVNLSSKLYNFLNFIPNGTVVKNEGIVTVPFYNNVSFNGFMEKYNSSLPKSLKTEFVKGLAGHQQYEIKEYFKNYDNNIIPIIYDKHTPELMERAFGKNTKTAAENRRVWMRMLPREGACLERIAGEPITMSDFLNTDHLQYMKDSAVRSTPSAIDGLKIVQRKILYGLRKQTNPYEFRKVFQLAGIIANVSNYHHGDQSLNKAIIKMGQSYPGSNNIPLLKGKGFFGSRLEGGKDAGQPRYIDVCLSKVADAIFPKIDDDLLEHVVEDNCVVEPTNYVPIVPMMLINGAKGLGTGYSTKIVKHSPHQIIKLVKDRMYGIKSREKLVPSINGWNGKIHVTDSSVLYIGSWHRVDERTIRITEIPIYTPINQFMDRVEGCEGVIEWVNNNKEDINRVDITIKLDRDVDSIDIDRSFGLSASEPYQNARNGIDINGELVKYASDYDIFEEWFAARYALYEQRKEKIIKKLEIEIAILENRIRFITLVTGGQLKLDVMSDEEIESYLKTNKFYMHDNSYDYLLSMPMRNMTSKKIDSLMDELSKKYEELDEYKQKTIETIWTDELDALEKLL